MPSIKTYFESAKEITLLYIGVGGDAYILFYIRRKHAIMLSLRKVLHISCVNESISAKLIHP